MHTDLHGYQLTKHYHRDMHPHTQRFYFPGNLLHLKFNYFVVFGGINMNRFIHRVDRQ
jgi:hypothetical protein